MSVNPFHTPFMLGFDELENMFLNIAKGSESFPPYNIEQTGPNTLRISLAVAGYCESDLDVSYEENQLIIRGKQETAKNRNYIYRGIAGRSFIKSFVLAEGLKIREAFLENWLLNIDLLRPIREKKAQKIAIKTKQENSCLISMQEEDMNG